MKNDQKCTNNCVNTLGTVTVFYSSVIDFHTEGIKGLTFGDCRNGSFFSFFDTASCITIFDTQTS